MKLKVLAGMLVATAAMAMSPIDDLNKAVVELLKPVNNNLTTVQLLFTNLEVDDKRALVAGVEADYKKKGALTDFHLSIPDLSYAYAGTFGPTASFNVSAEADLLSVMDQEMINEMGPMVSEIATDMAKDFLEEYGPAAEVEVKTVEEKYDDEGNLHLIKVVGKVKVDLAKLPENIPADTVPIINANVTLTAGLMGLSAQGTVIMNKDGKYFEEDTEGLKEMIENLLRQDETSMQELQEMVIFIDRLIGDFINNGFKH